MMRMIESERANGLFRDPQAGLVAEPEAYAWYESLSTETKASLTTMVAVRTRWIDDAVRVALAKRDAQVVVIGSGSDTRYARAVYSPRARVFELDFPQVLSRMTDHVLSSRYAYHRIEVPCDLREDGLARLEAHPEFRCDEQTIWIVEGLTGYLKHDECRLVLAESCRLSGEGSQILATFVGSSLRAFGPTAPRSKQHTFATDQPAALMAECGWHAVQYAIGDIAISYRRSGLDGYDYWLCRGYLD